MFCSQPRICFFFLQVWCPVVLASGHRVLLKSGLPDKVFKNVQHWKTCTGNGMGSGGLLLAFCLEFKSGWQFSALFVVHGLSSLWTTWPDHLGAAAANELHVWSFTPVLPPCTFLVTATRRKTWHCSVFAQNNFRWGCSAAEAARVAQSSVWALHSNQHCAIGWTSRVLAEER